jgi:hypothetical protein
MDCVQPAAALVRQPGGAEEQTRLRTSSAACPSSRLSPEALVNSDRRSSGGSADFSRPPQPDRPSRLKPALPCPPAALSIRPVLFIACRRIPRLLVPWPTSSPRKSAPKSCPASAVVTPGRSGSSAHCSTGTATASPPIDHRTLLVDRQLLRFPQLLNHRLALLCLSRFYPANSSHGSPASSASWAGSWVIQLQLP